MKPISILIRREFHERFADRLADLAPSATFLTFTTRDEMLAALPDVDGLYGGSPSDDIVQRSGRLKWIHMRRAGVEHDEPATLAAHGITLTKGAGAFDVAIAEHVLAMVLSLARCIPHCVRSQASASWSRDVAPIQVSGRALGVYGVGSVGSELARKANGLGMRVYGVTRRARQTPVFMEALWTEERFDEFLALSDVVVMCAALTEATRGRFGAREYGLMKPTSYFINICRGQTVVQDDLIAALESGSIAGAGLDVTDPEPLPEESPLWHMPNVIITPHVSGLSDRTEERADEIVFENIRRFAAGEPLVNVVDPNEGY